jgi:two-component system chemotaxis response regulator CheB
MRALEAGAVDFIDKSTARSAMDILSIAGELITKVKALSGVDVSKVVPARPGPAPPGPAPLPAARPGIPRYDAVVVGASTGGPPALQAILTALPDGLPACVLVVQHMPIGFTASLAERLDGLCPYPVSEAVDGEPVLPGRCLIAPSGLHMGLVRTPRGVAVRLSREPEGLLHRPSVDMLMNSAAEVLGSRALGVLLTGMGADGAAGMTAIRQAGGLTIAQDEATCVVYGMPRVAVERGGVVRSLPLDGIAHAVMGELGVY